MPTVTLGNVAPVDAQAGITVGDEETETVALPVPHAETLVVVDCALPLVDQLREVDNVWRLHSTEPPAWVEGVDEVFVGALAQNFGCPVGKPADWEIAS